MVDVMLGDYSGAYSPYSAHVETKKTADNVSRYVSVMARQKHEGSRSFHIVRQTNCTMCLVQSLYLSTMRYDMARMAKQGMNNALTM